MINPTLHCVDGPLVSIITPCRNGIAFIEQTILSVINQSYTNVEYIIIDGGSSDGTLNIIHRYEDSIDYWISEPDDGMYQAINKGIQRASGEIIAYLNSDDLYFPGTIEKVVNFFAESPAVDLLYGNLDFIDETGNRLFTQIYPKFYWSRFVSANHAMIGQPAAFWRANLHDKIGHFDESMKMAADFDFFIRAGLKGNLDHTNDVLAAFRVHPSSLTSSQIKRGKFEVQYLHKKYHVDTQSTLEKTKKNLYFLYFKLINYKVVVVKLVSVFRRMLSV
jgi:glycosyltransferase involved in cell wall biosynthesis